MTIRRVAAVVIAATAAVLVLPGLLSGDGAPDATDPTWGAAGMGDPYFRLDGNGGYDVGHYSVTLQVGDDRHPVQGAGVDPIRGTAVMDATATQRLTRFNLDLAGLTVDSVTVGGTPATWWRTRRELTIVPSEPLAKGAPFRTVVAYHGTPVQVTTPDGMSNGWFSTRDGATNVGEPPSAQTWFPVNEHPSDKALLDVSVRVPEGLSAISNGLLTSQRTAGGWTTWTWRSTHPMASYLVLLSIGDFDVRTSRTAAGLPIIDAVDPALHGAADAALARQAEVIGTLEEALGPYPLEAAGAVVDQLSTGYALETQTRPFYSQYFFTGSRDDAYVLAHELAHQWFGDSVTLSSWQDIWLNESFGTYAEWLWAEHEGAFTPADVMSFFMTDVPPVDSLWALDISDPGPRDLFAPAVYVRGGLVLEALRETIGDADFLTVVRQWARANADGNVTTRQFVDLAEKVSRRDLSSLFDAWLFTPGQPSAPPAMRRATPEATARVRAYLQARAAQG